MQERELRVNVCKSKFMRWWTQLKIIHGIIRGNNSGAWFVPHATICNSLHHMSIGWYPEWSVCHSHTLDTSAPTVEAPYL